MWNPVTEYCLNTITSRMERLQQENDALRATIREERYRYQTVMELYCGYATEMLAISRELDHITVQAGIKKLREHPPSKFVGSWEGHFSAQRKGFLRKLRRISNLATRLAQTRKEFCGTQKPVESCCQCGTGSERP